MIFFPIKYTDNGQETLILKKGDYIGEKSFNGMYPWTRQPFVLMATKSEPYFDKPISWEGQWKNLSHVYQAFCLVYPTGDSFFGWVELSFDTATEKLMIHAAGISTEAGKGVRAGYR